MTDDAIAVKEEINRLGTKANAPIVSGGPGTTPEKDRVLWLVEAKTSAQKTSDEKLRDMAELDTDVDALTANYRKHIEGMLPGEQAKGDLEAILALKEESSRPGQTKLGGVENSDVTRAYASGRIMKDF